MRISKDCVVAVSLVMRNAAGQLLDTTEGHLPLLYLHGRGQLIPGLERALEGRQAGDQMEVVVPPEQAYGERDPELVQSLPRSALDSQLPVQVGMVFEAHTEDGPIGVRVVEVTENTLTVDGNHEWAGETLHFKVRVRHVRQATPQELAEGEADPDTAES